MKLFISIVFVSLMGQLVAVKMDMDECFVHCDVDNNTCVSHSCYRSGTMTECRIYSTYKEQSDIHAAMCLDPEDVKGFDEFCRNILAKVRSPTIENIQTEQTTIDSDRTAPAKNVSYLEDRCLGTTALASVASGSFVAGCFVMWLIIALLRCIDPCKPDKANESYMEISETPESQMSIPPSRASRSRPTDLRQASNVSVDSGMSSTQVTTPTHVTQAARRPPANSSLFSFPAPRPPVPTGNNPGTYPPAQYDGVYAPISECSNRDYQSIQGEGSVYAPSSEDGDSDYSSHPTHRVLFIQENGEIYMYQPSSDRSFYSDDELTIPYNINSGNSDYSSHPTHRVLFIQENGEIYQPSSESSGNDYTSLNGNHGNTSASAIYYPTSDSSCKDYSSLLDEGELSDLATGGYCDVDDMIVDASGNHDNVKFRVSGFVIPKQKLSTKGRPAPALEKVNEYEVIPSHKDDPVMADEYSRPVDALPEGGDMTCAGDAGIAANRRLPMDGFHLSELSRASLRSKPSLPHNYLVLEPDNDI